MDKEYDTDQTGRSIVHRALVPSSYTRLVLTGEGINIVDVPRGIRRVPMIDKVSHLQSVDATGNMTIYRPGQDEGIHKRTRVYEHQS